MNDKMEREKADARNAVEEYVYDMREKLCDKFSEFVSEKVRLQRRKRASICGVWVNGVVSHAGPGEFPVYSRRNWKLVVRGGGKRSEERVC